MGLRGSVWDRVGVGRRHTGEVVQPQMGVQTSYVQNAFSDLFVLPQDGMRQARVRTAADDLKKAWAALNADERALFDRYHFDDKFKVVLQAMADEEDKALLGALTTTLTGMVETMKAVPGKLERLIQRACGLGSVSLDEWVG